MEYTTGTPSWRLVMRRAITALRPRRRRERQGGWSVGTPLIALAAGVLFTTSATAADGTELRDDRRPQLAQLISERRERIEQREQLEAELRSENEEATSRIADGDQPLRQARSEADALRQQAGFTSLDGPGLTVVLNDSNRRTTDSGMDSAQNDDLVVHQGDVQAVVNAMWAGGAEAMSIMDVRVISTSAVRCVGNTLLLHGQVFSPPFKVTAIGDSAAMQQALASSEGVQQFRAAVADYGLGYSETVERNVTVPAYDGSSDLRSAEVVD